MHGSAIFLPEIRNPPSNPSSYHVHLNTKLKLFQPSSSIVECGYNSCAIGLGLSTVLTRTLSCRCAIIPTGYTDFSLLIRPLRDSLPCRGHIRALEISSIACAERRKHPLQNGLAASPPLTDEAFRLRSAATAKIRWGDTSLLLSPGILFC